LRNFGTVASEGCCGLNGFGLLVEIEFLHLLFEFELFVLNLLDFPDLFEFLFLSEQRRTMRLVSSSSLLFSSCLSLISAPRSLFMSVKGVRKKNVINQKAKWSYLKLRFGKCDSVFRM
jgi:hypothetical protein